MTESGVDRNRDAEDRSVKVRVVDRRPRFEGQPSDGAAREAAPPEGRYPSFVAELQDRARLAEAKLAEALNLLRRRESEADEFRARLRREMEKRSRAEVENFLGTFLEVVDSLDRGIAAAEGEQDPLSLRQGLIRVRDQFFSALAREGVEPMTLTGTEYDPHLAEAVAIAPAVTEEDDNRVVEELRRGFVLGAKVLRPAQVRVARRPVPAAQEARPEAPPAES